MTKDPYQNLAEHYDLMKTRDVDRENFFNKIFKKYKVKEILDCACGTGNDLIMFCSLGYNVTGSDLSRAMLAQARQKLKKYRSKIKLYQADFRCLKERFRSKFDAVLCLTNAINEPLKDSDAIKALKSMRSILKSGGILIFDQGQTDASMKNPPKYAPIINDSNFSRLFVMNYFNRQMEVNLFDFIHAKNKFAFKHNSIRIRIRLKDEWGRMLKKTGFKRIEYYGDWERTPYNKKSSKRLIVVAQKGNEDKSSQFHY